MKKYYIETEADVRHFLSECIKHDSPLQIIGIVESLKFPRSGIIVAFVGDIAYVLNYAYHSDMIPTPIFAWPREKLWVTVTAKSVHQINSRFFIIHSNDEVIDIAKENIQSPFQNVHEHHIHEIVDWAISLHIPNLQLPSTETWNSRVYIPTLAQLEQTHLYYNNEKVPVVYNPYTATTRASSKLYLPDGGTLFIPSLTPDKKKLITSRYSSGMLINLDFDAFHLRLIAHYLKVPIPHKSLHMHYAKKYFQTQAPTSEQYRSSKEKTFHTIYSDKEPEIGDDLFDAIIKFKKSITPTSELYTYESRKVPDDEWTTKRFNYWIQMMEVEMSIQLIRHMMQHAFYPNICLYIYDSILIDVDDKDIEVIMDAIILWNEKNPNFPLTVSAGKDYASLTKVN